MITASDARELMKSAGIINQIETEIRKAALSGKSEVIVNSINKVVQQQIESLGYTVKEYKQPSIDFRGESSFEIKHIIGWEK